MAHLSSAIAAAGLCRRAVSRLSRAMGFAAGWLFVVCALVITADVVGRNFLGAGVQASTELSGYMLAVGTSWALAHTLVERAHVRIDLLVDRLPIAPRRVLHLVSLAILTVVVGFMAYGAVDLVGESWLFGATDISVLHVPLVVPQGLWAFGLCVFLLLVVLLLAECVLLLAAGRGQEVERRLHARGYDEEVREALEAVGMAGIPRAPGGPR